VAEALGLNIPKESCLQSYRSKLSAYFPALAPAIIRDRQLPIFIAGGRGSVSLQDSMVYLLMLSQLRESFSIANVRLSQRSRLVGADLVANFVMVFTTNDLSRLSLEENRTLLMDGYLNLPAEVSGLEAIVGAERVCDNLTLPNLGWNGGYRRVVPSVR
jgi:hypothetical protein